MDHINSSPFKLPIVYAKCDVELRKDLWADLRTVSLHINEPWGAVGDFNVFTDKGEKLGRIPHRLEERLDFIECHNECGLLDARYTVTVVKRCNRDPPPQPYYSEKT